jgi:hypothetical protein
MQLKRRSLLAAPAALIPACGGPDGPATGWPVEWDRLLIQRAVSIQDQLYDDKVGLVTKLLGPTYQYHTRLRDMRAHPTRESLEYALWLLESGDETKAKRAFRVIERVISLQDTDPRSKWYGIWGWYFEEPPSAMQPADWNWADFNGSTLLLIELRHGARLPNELRPRVRESIRHCAASIQRRNVSMSYTNIAVKGTFVTLAAAELLQDASLLAYAQDRSQRLTAEVEKTGSFSEYNSPTYARVALTNLTRIRMFVKDPGSRERAAALERRFWLHLARHWDFPRKQFAGPMSRCYSTDIGYPLWLEKSLGGRLRLASPDNRSSDRGEGAGETAVHDYRVPEDLAPLFLQDQGTRLHRELFVLPANPDVRPVQGSTYLHPSYSVGSVNRGDFWNQRRPLLVYFGTDARPAQTVTFRMVKDSYDFSSALLYSVQKDNCVLGLVSFRTPGGDRHISLDPIAGGAFQASRLFLEVDVEGLGAGFSHSLENGELSVMQPGFAFAFQVRGGRFGTMEPALKATPSSQSLVLTADLLPAGGARTVSWQATPEAWIAFTLICGAERHGGEFRQQSERGRVTLTWSSPAGALELSGSTRPGPIEQQDLAFREKADGQEIPIARLA